MGIVTSLALSARVTLNMHSLNNEGTEGNQQQTRMVHIIDGLGRRAVVNAVSGDMFKHILVEHLTPLLSEAGDRLSPGARKHDADRIQAGNPEFTDFCQKEQEFATPEGKTEKRRARESEVMTRMLQDCAVTDLAGALVTKPSVGRKSVAEFGWVVGLPYDGEGNPVTTTEQYFHVKYAPEGRGKATGGETVAGQQAIFHRPASSGVYALICNLDIWRIGLNDITREFVVSRELRRTRARCLIEALAATLVKPTGAQRNTQNPHIVACEGAIAVSSRILPAPTVSPLADAYREQIELTAAQLNRMQPGAITTYSFDTLAEGVDILAQISGSLELPEV
ncbi:MAG: DevR family CRISPR-associated autoregulator [bacterium]|nr:DevR family CRISPR-associated autoregulator [bacterium]